MLGLVVFDGDDTLWETERLYDEARQRIRRLVEAAGIDGEAWETLERVLDVKNVERMGLSISRFPTSCLDAYLQMVASPDAAVEDAIWSEAGSVFEQDAPLYPDAATAVTELGRDFRLVLMTKGDSAVQERRIAHSGLERRFDEVVVTGHKDAHLFSTVAERYRVSSGQAWSIGNSLRSDILPAVESGFRAVWIERHVWEYERQTAMENLPGGVFRAATLTEAADLVIGIHLEDVSSRKQG